MALDAKQVIADLQAQNQAESDDINQLLALNTAYVGKVRDLTAQLAAATAAGGPSQADLQALVDITTAAHQNAEQIEAFIKQNSASGQPNV